jgi:hypothetical protein
MKRRRKQKKKIGTSALGVSLVLLLLALIPLTAEPKKKPALDVYAVVSGSVFDDSGYALPDASVILAPQAQPGGSAGKIKPMETVSDVRGEFVFRVPPGPTEYTVAASAKGYRGQRKSVSVQDQEREEVTFQLERESK